jgi:hypothetical protein
MQNTELNVMGCNWVKRCPRNWTELDPTEDSDVRHCTVCNEFVYLCHSEDQLRYHANRRHCAAVESALPETGGMMLGDFIELAYDGPFLSLWLLPTYTLNNAQLEFVARLANLQLPVAQLRAQLCDGEPHLITKGLTVSHAESLQARLQKRQIICSVTVDPQ